MKINSKKSKVIGRMITAVSLSRIYQQVEEGENFALLSAFVSNVDKKDNLEKQWELMEDVRDLGYGYVPVEGFWMGTSENSVFIYGMTFDEAMELSQRYNQFSFIHGSRGVWGEFSTDGELMQVGEEFHALKLDEEAMAYSQLKGRKFVLAEAKGYLGKNIHISDRKIFIPRIPMPKLVKEGILNFKVSKSAMISILPTYFELWDISDDIISSRWLRGGNYLEKFSFDPLTGEFLLSSPGQDHASEIYNKGNSPYDNYVRGIILHSSKQIVFRPVFPEYIREQYESGRMNEEDVRVKSFDLQYSTMEVLQGSGATNWEFQYNIDNKMMAEQTGDYLTWSRA